MQKFVSAFALRMLLGVFCVPLVGTVAGCHVHHSQGRHDNGLHRGHHKKKNPGKKKGHAKHKKHKKLTRTSPPTQPSPRDPTSTRIVFRVRYVM